MFSCFSTLIIKGSVVSEMPQTVYGCHPDGNGLLLSLGNETATAGVCSCLWVNTEIICGYSITK